MKRFYYFPLELFVHIESLNALLLFAHYTIIYYYA